eukprot:365401-Chlamydomonas_euryale.AAC.6
MHALVWEHMVRRVLCGNTCSEGSLAVCGTKRLSAAIPTLLQAPRWVLPNCGATRRASWQCVTGAIFTLRNSKGLAREPLPHVAWRCMLHQALIRPSLPHPVLCPPTYAPAVLRRRRRRACLSPTSPPQAPRPGSALQRRPRRRPPRCRPCQARAALPAAAAAPLLEALPATRKARHLRTAPAAAMQTGTALRRAVRVGCGATPRQGVTPR